MPENSNDFYLGEVCSINSIQDLLDNTKRLGVNKLLGDVRFRGQANKHWSLIPTIGRRNHYQHGGNTIEQFTPEQERILLHRFRRQAYHFIGRDLDEWETLFWARHHGLPVRLLDWTSNPLVALYWSCVGNESTIDGAVWAFHGKAQKQLFDIYNKEIPSPLSVTGIRVLHHQYTSPRMIAQASCFTIQENPWQELETCSIKNPATFDIDVLEKWIIPSAKKRKFLEELERFGCSARILFPDLDGLARGLWNTEALRMGK